MLRSRPGHLLVACAAVLIAGHIAGLVARQVWGVDPELGLVRQFDLNGEGNIAAFFASFLLLCSAAACLLVARVKALRGHLLAERWTVLSAFFFLMALDEASQIHDMATGPLRNGLGLDFGILYFAWLIPALLILGAAAFYFAPIVGDLSPTIRPQLLIATIVYLSGAVGMEMVSGNVVAEGRQSLIYLVTMTVEETLEICGGLLFLNALLNQARELRPRLSLTWPGLLPEVAELPAPAATRTDADN